MPGIYVASKAHRGPMWLALRAAEEPIISTWIDESDPGATLDWADLFSRCVREASSAGALVIYSEPGDVLKGALVEVGAALASGVPVFWVGPLQNCVHHPLVTVCASLSEAMELARRAAARPTLGYGTDEKVVP